MKRIVQILFFIYACSLCAHEEHQHCELSSSTESVYYDKGVLRIEKADSTLMIDEDNQLFINGHAIKLDSKEQQLIDKYKADYSLFIENLAQLTMESTRVGISVTMDVINTLFGADEAFIKDLRRTLKDFDARLKDTLAANQIWSKEKLENLFEHNFSKKLEEVYDALATHLTENVFSNLLSPTFWKNIARLEEHMSQLEQELGEKLTRYEKQLESHVQALCKSIKAIEAMEKRVLESDTIRFAVKKTPAGTPAFSI